jgi:hypothetical protein
MQVNGLSTGDSHVGNQGTNPGLGPQSSSKRALSTVVHRLSTGFVPRGVDNVETLPTRRPQNLQQEIHTLPQAVDNRVTLRVCPHRFPQALSTSVGFGF